jgi:deoxyribonuclease-1
MVVQNWLYLLNKPLMTIAKVVFYLSPLFLSSASLAYGNTSNDSFSKAKKVCEIEVYHGHRVTIYCGYKFDAKKNLEKPNGFVTRTHLKRAKIVEWDQAQSTSTGFWTCI